MKFEPKNRELVLQSTNNLLDKIQFIQNLYDKAAYKINHFDKLRQQLLNYGLLVFSGLLAFVIKTEQIWLHLAGCIAIIVLMIIFRSIDQRYHKFTHGFTASMFVFSQAIAYLLDNPNEEVKFFQYATEGEKTTQKWSLYTKIYFSLASAAVILGIIILVRLIV